MSDTDSLASEEVKPMFRPFTRESLVAIHSRMTDEQMRKKELERKRAEGEVSFDSFCETFFEKFIRNGISLFEMCCRVNK
jgi:hypothetical protein